MEILTDGDGFYYAKGIQDARDFVQETERQHDRHALVLDVEISWVRFVPRWDGEPGMFICDAKPHTRGAFVITNVIEIRRTTP